MLKVDKSSLKNKLDVGAHACNPVVQEARGLEVQGQPELLNETLSQDKKIRGIRVVVEW